MLGLGNSITSGAALEDASLTPSDISGLDVWLQVNKGISGASNTSDAGNMVDGEQIYSWADQSGNNNHASDINGALQRPVWETDAADFGGAKFDGTDDGLDFNTNITISANQDFTVMIRAKVTDLTANTALYGNSGTDVLKVIGSLTGKKLNAVIGGSGGNPFEEASDTLLNNKYYIITLTRSNGSDGDLNLRVHGDAFTDKNWDSDAANADNDAFTIDHLAVHSSNALSMEGVIKDFLVWKGTALSDSERAAMYTYILAQDY